MRIPFFVCGSRVHIFLISSPCSTHCFFCVWVCLGVVVLFKRVSTNIIIIIMMEGMAVDSFNFKMYTKSSICISISVLRILYFNWWSERVYVAGTENSVNKYTAAWHVLLTSPKRIYLFTLFEIYCMNSVHTSTATRLNTNSNVRQRLGMETKKWQRYGEWIELAAVHEFNRYGSSTAHRLLTLMRLNHSFTRLSEIIIKS